MTLMDDISYIAGYSMIPNTFTLSEKCELAIEYLGERWVLHPNYKFNPKHSQLPRKEIKNEKN